MQPVKENPLITDDYLSGLDMDNLMDLLQHKTGLLLTTIYAGVLDAAYLDSVREDLKKIQEVIRTRKAAGTNSATRL